MMGELGSSLAGSRMAVRAMGRGMKRMDGAVTKRSEEPEASLAGARVLVTGGAGFIGSHVVDQLVRAGCGEVIVARQFCPSDTR